MIPKPMFSQTFRQALRHELQASPVWWKDPDPEQLIWYKMHNGGESLLISQTPIDATFQSPALPAAPLAGDLWIIHSWLANPRLWWQQICLHENVLPCFFQQGYLILGPVLSLNSHLCPTCLGLRLAQSFPRPDLFENALLAEPQASITLHQMLGNHFAQETFSHFIEGYRDRLCNGEVLALPITAVEEIHWHQLLAPPGPHPWHLVTDHIATLFGIPQLSWAAPNREQTSDPGREIIDPLDPLLGPLLATSVLPAEKDEPVALTTAVAITGSLGEFIRWKPDVSGTGCNFIPSLAEHAAVGEAVERYCGNYPPQLPLYTEQELAQTGQSYIGQNALFVWSQAQTSSQLWPFTLPGPGAIPWVEATAIAPVKKKVLLPAEVVYLNLPRVIGPAIFPVALAGIAAGRNRQQAEDAALLELVERDATMLYWHAGAPARRLCELPDNLRSTLETGTAAWIEQWYLLLPTDLPIPVVGACLYDTKNHILTVGFAARLNLAEAIRKAAAEAWQLRRLSLLLLDPTSLLWQGIEDGSLPFPTVGFRSDRQYAQVFQADFANMEQLAYNLEYYLDPATHPYAISRLSGQAIQYEQAQALWQEQSSSVLERCIPWLLHQKQELYSVDLTTPDMRAGGFIVSRVLCPGLVGNAATAFLPLAHPRLLQAAAQHGGISLIPMPHA